MEVNEIRHPQVEELLRQINSELDYHFLRSKRLKNKAYFFKISTMVLGALVTILLGFQLSKEYESEWSLIIKNTALIIGAIITTISSIGAFWNADKYWLNNTMTAMRLLNLKKEMLLELKSENGIEPIKLNKLKGEYEIINKSKVEYWEDALKSE